MRIVIAKKLLSSIGGSEAQARALATALHERGHDVTLVGLRPAWRRPGIPAAVYASPPGPVAVREGGVRYVFIPALGGRVGAAIDGLAPTTLVSRNELGRAIAGAEVVHSSAREWVGPLERAARDAGAAFVETPLVHPGQPFSGDSAADLAQRRDVAGDDRTPRGPRLEVRLPEGLVVRGHREDRRARVGLRLRLFAHHAAIDPPLVAP